MQKFIDIELQYEILNDICFSPSEALLSKLYQPIIGIDSISIYNFLRTIIKERADILTDNCSIYEIIRNLSISIEEFHTARQKLEAMGLLKTYYNNSNKLMSFKLIEPLSYKDFVVNKRFFNLLCQKFNKSEIELLGTKLSNRRVVYLEDEISADIASIFSNDKFDQYSFNFDLLYEKIVLVIKTPWKLELEAKEIIENYHKNFKLSFEKIFEACINSFNGKSGSQYIFDKPTLLIQLDSFVIEQNQIKNNTIVELRRDKTIFDKQVFNIEFNQIFLDYKNNNSIKYFSSILKRKLERKEIEKVNTLLKKYQLEDEILNIVCDFSLYKSYGKINFKYIEKTLTTLSGLALNTLEQVYEYFLSLSKKNNHKSIKEETKSTNVNLNDYDFSDFE